MTLTPGNPMQTPQEPGAPTTQLAWSPDGHRYTLVSAPPTPNPLVIGSTTQDGNLVITGTDPAGQGIPRITLYKYWDQANSNRYGLGITDYGSWQTQLFLAPANGQGWSTHISLQDVPDQNNTKSLDIWSDGRIISQAIGTAPNAPASMALQVQNVVGLRLDTSGNASIYGNLSVTAASFSGPLTFTPDNALDIGATGARPRSIYAGTSVLSPLHTTVSGVMIVGPTASSNLLFQSGGTTRWFIDFNGQLNPNTQNTNDIGSTNQMRNVLAVGALKTGGKAGVAVDADVTSPTDGMMRYDSTNNRFYMRIGGTWRYATLT